MALKKLRTGGSLYTGVKDMFVYWKLSVDYGRIGNYTNCKTFRKYRMRRESMKKRGVLKRISLVTALMMFITVFSIPWMGYAAELTPAAQNGFGVAIGDNVNGGYTPVITEGIVIKDLYDEDLDYGDGPYNPFEITYGNEEGVPEGVITISSSDPDVVTVTTYHQPDNDVPIDYQKSEAKINVSDEEYTTQYFDLCYMGFGHADITVKHTAPNGEEVTVAEFPVTIKGVVVFIEQDIFTYDGNIKTPKIGVVDWQGNIVSEDNYTVNYAEGRKLPGVYEIEVAFKESYTEYQGSWLTYFLITPKAPASVSTRLTGHDDIRVSWKSSTGADGYYVYYKKGSGSYKLLKSVTGTYATAANLTDGAKYTFKVVPYMDVDGMKFKSASYKTSSAIYTLKKISTPKISKSGTKVKVRWTNISGETGYQISRSTKSKGTNIVATYKTTKGTYKNVSAKKGTKYYYKVRAYKSYVVNGKTVKVYGPWSSVKSYRR